MSADFIDTNVFIYLFDETSAAKREVAEQIVRSGLESGGVISYQVVQETLNVLTRKVSAPASAADARQFLDAVLSLMWRGMPTSDLFHRAIDIQGRYGYSFYDSLIIAAALEAGCSRLLSEDLQDGQRIDGLTIVNPFAA